jgi:hypothetical protein
MRANRLLWQMRTAGMRRERVRLEFVVKRRLEAGPVPAGRVFK